MTVKCGECGLVYLNPRPSPDALSELYQERGYYSLRGGSGGDYEDYINDKRRYAIETNLSKLRYLKKYGRGDTLLDVGCACGIFLDIARTRGYKVYGIEISGWSCNIAAQDLHLTVEKTSLAEAEFGPSSFDIVTMWDVLEHSSDPLGDLKKAGGFLKPGGLLAIQVPNLRCLNAAMLKEKWGWLLLPYHLYFFTPSTLRAIVEQARFKVIKIRTYHVDLWDIMLRKAFNRYSETQKSAVIRMYDEKKNAGTAGYFILRQLKNIFYFLHLLIKIALYPLIIITKRGSLIQVYAVKI